MASATAGKRAQGKSNGNPPPPKHNIDAVREAYYERISKFDMAPLWKVMKSVVTKEPVTRCVPVIWHYQDVKPLVMDQTIRMSGAPSDELPRRPPTSRLVDPRNFHRCYRVREGNSSEGDDMASITRRSPDIPGTDAHPNIRGAC